MIYIVRINDKQYEVEVERGRANLLNISNVAVQTTAPVAAVQAPVAPQPAPVNTPPAAPPAPNANAAENAIQAPMPGTILDIKVSNGQTVKSGDVLLVFEAMKMENEIVAPKDGVVVQVFVAKGATINTGDALIAMQ